MIIRKSPWWWKVAVLAALMVLPVAFTVAGLKGPFVCAVSFTYGIVVVCTASHFEPRLFDKGGER